MNRIGNNASGGTIEVTDTNGPSKALAPGNSPITIPRTSAATVEIASADPSRSRLATVSEAIR
ncbi:hypothetical protein ACVWW1_005286 [Bradyrhizobium sp. JR3.5]